MMAKSTFYAEMQETSFYFFKFFDYETKLTKNDILEIFKVSVMSFYCTCETN